MITILFVIGISLSIYEELIDTRPLTLLSISETIGKTIIIGIFPLTGIVLLNQIRLLKKHHSEVRTINASLYLNPDSNTEIGANMITIESDNKSEYFHKNILSILFLVSLGNYIEIYTDENGKVERTILRTTLAKVEEQLSAYSQLFRCHRAFIVNIQKITSIDGNASGYTLCFKNTDKIVSVSRRSTSKFKSIMRGI